MGDERLAFGEKFNPYRKFPTGVWIPEGLSRYRGLSAEAKLLYGQLLRHAGENGKCFPTKKSLSTVLGVDERTIQHYIRELATNHHGYEDRQLLHVICARNDPLTTCTPEEGAVLGRFSAEFEATSKLVSGRRRP